MSRGRYSAEQIKADNPPQAVFQRLNIPYRERNGRLHAPCPGCGKSNKFDYNLKKHVFYCFSCQFGDGFSDVIGLVRAVLGYDFLAACEYLGGARDISDADRERLEQDRLARDAAHKRAESRRLTRVRKDMEAILAGCVAGPSTHAETYLRTRGHSRALDALGWPSDIVFHPGLEAFIGSGESAKCVGVFPAMVAKGRENGKLVLLHRTYLMECDNGHVVKAVPPAFPDGFGPEDWNAKQMRGVLGRCVDGVHLGTHPEFHGSDHAPIVVAEGIESALAFATAGVKGAFYAALSLNRLVGQTDPETGASVKGWVPPIKTSPVLNGHPVLIAADNDLAPTHLHPEFEMVGTRKVSAARAQAEFGQATARLSTLAPSVGAVFPPLGFDPDSWLMADPAMSDPAPCVSAVS